MHCLLRDFDKVFFEGNVIHVYFKTPEFGQIGILKNHEEGSFNIAPGCVEILTQEENFIFHVGVGFANVKDNIISLLAFPIAVSFEEFGAKCEKIGEYGQRLNKAYNLYASEF